ncbi:MAG: lipid II flippase MurJ [Ramlibacter sp.]
MNAEQRSLDTAMVRGMGLIAVFAGVSGLARLGQDAAIAWRFGAGAQVDAYYFVLSLVAWPAAVALAVLTTLLAPTAAALAQGAAGEAQRFRAELLGCTLLLAAVSLPVAWTVLNGLTSGSASGLAPATAEYARAGVPVLALMVPLGFLVALLSAWFVAGGRHGLTLLEGLPPLVLMLLVLAWPGPGPVLFWATVAGAGLQLLLMAWWLRRWGELPLPRLGLRAAGWQAFSHGALAFLAAQMLFALFPLVDALLAARLPEGSLAAVSFAARLVLGLQGIGGLALQRAGLPLLSRLMAGSRGGSAPTVMRWAALAGLTGLVMGIVVALLAEPLVSLLYEHGSFTASDSAEVATLLRYGMLQMPPFLASITLVTGLASAAARRSLAVVAPVGFLAKLVFSLALVGPFGAAGLMVATALMYCATALVTWWLIRRNPRVTGPQA